MTPEQNIKETLLAVCPNVGHWPLLRDAGVYIGYRPSGDAPEWAGNRAIASQVSYDIVIYHRLGHAEEAEAMRYAVYAALRQAGWLLDARGAGPEVYISGGELFCWPLTVTRRFYILNNTPLTPEDIRARSAMEGDTSP